jgi:hypothetical protein
LAIQLALGHFGCIATSTCCGIRWHNVKVLFLTKLQKAKCKSKPLYFLTHTR